jgi:hypothetical protein
MRDIDVCWFVFVVIFTGNKILISLLYTRGIVELFFFNMIY